MDKCTKCRHYEEDVGWLAALADELDVKIQDFSNMQDEELREVNLGMQGTQPESPRLQDLSSLPFMSSFSQEEAHMHYNRTKQLQGILLRMGSGLLKISEIEEVLLKSYKNLVKQEGVDELKWLYQEEKQEVDRLKKQLKKITKEFDELASEVNLTPRRKQNSEAESSKYCENCRSYAHSLKDFQYELASLKQELKTAEELLRNSANEKLDLENENQDLKYRLNSDQDQSSVYLQKQCNDLQVANADLIRRLEEKQKELDELSGMASYYQEEQYRRDEYLDKAKSIIKKLNDECEKQALQLQQSERLVEKYKHDAHDLERKLQFSQRQLNETEVLKTTEIRLRGANADLKAQLENIKAAYHSETQELNNVIQGLIQDKSELNAAIEELEEKLNEIEAESVNRDQELQQKLEIIRRLEITIAEKDRMIEATMQQTKQVEDNLNEEIAQLKRTAQNTIKQLQHFQSQSGSEINGYRTPTKPAVKKFQHISTTPPKSVQDKTPEKIGQEPPPVLVLSLQNQLEEALQRENALRRQVKQLVEREAQHISKALGQINENQFKTKNEIERWIMRNEDLEQRLRDTCTQNIKLRETLSKALKLIQYYNAQSHQIDDMQQRLISQLDKSRQA